MGNNNTAGIFVTIPAILLLLLLSFSSPLSITTTMAQQIPLTPPSLTSPTTPLASAQEESTSSPPLPPTLPFTPFSLQRQEAVPEEGTGNTTGTTPTPATNDTEGGVTELTSSATEPPLIAEIIPNATQAVAPATIRFDANITGGAPPYSYSWSDSNLGLIDQDRSITLNFFEPGTFTYGLTVVDSRGKTVTDNVQIVISERVPQGGIVAPEPGGVAPPQEEGGLLPGTPPPPPPNDNEVISPPEGGGEEEPPTTTEEEGGEEPSAPPPPDDTGEEGGESPPDEEPTIPPG
jgi:hypothetical protein